jgi:predicted Zn finger-like uncharacterized protein
MSLAARCPWCETVFRLTEGQVSAKGGMARCGVCNHTFNALDALLSDSAVAALERGAQAREANQEATTARANEQGASRPPESIPIPISIRKMFGGASTPSPAAAPATLPSSPPPSPFSAPLAPPSTVLSAAPPEAAASAFTTPAAASPREQAAPVVAAEKTPAATEARLPEARHEPVPAPTPPVAPPAETRQAQPADRTADQPAEQSVDAEQPFAPAPDGSIESASSQAQHPAPPPEIPSDYKVEMPNYDAERAAALLEAERLQRKQQERHERKQRSELEEARAALAAQLEEVQSALSPTSDAEQHGHDAPEGEATSATLQSLRLQHAAVQAASKSDLAREDDRLGPNTFQPSFLLSTPSSGRFHRTRRLFGSLLILALFICLLGQATYWWRSDVAMRVPQTRPYLVRACQRLHCEVEPPAQIDQLSIESSELVAAPGTAGALAFTALVRNHSTNALAYPAIEITLTDARDQAILRRVFLPDNYLGDALGNRRLAGIPGNSEYTLKLTFSTSGVATSGYRAGIFYP